MGDDRAGTFRALWILGLCGRSGARGTPTHGAVGLNVVGFIEELNEFGPIGLFLISFISNAIPGFPAIYLAFVGSYALVASDIGHSILAIVVSGVGAGLGKVLVFMSSRALGHASKRLQRVRENTEWLGEEAEKGVFILVLLFAALPLPDDLLYIPLGLTGFKAVSFTIAVVLGKIILTGLVFFLGKAYKSAFNALFAAQGQENLGLLVGGMIAASIVATAVIFSMDWKKIYMAYKKEGWVKATIVLILELIRVLTFNLIGPERRPSRREAIILSASILIGAAAGWEWLEWRGSIALGVTMPIIASMILWLDKKLVGEKSSDKNGSMEGAAGPIEG